MFKFSMDYQKILNYLFIGLAFSLPVSKAGVSLFEILIILVWAIEGNWKVRFQEYSSSKVIMTLFMFISLLIISLFWAKDLLEGIAYIGKYWHFLIILVLFTELKKEYIPVLISSFLSGVFLCEVVSYGIFFEIWKYKDVLPTDPSPFMDHISYSVFLAFTAMILLCRIFSEFDSKKKFIYILLLISVTTNLFLNGGRTGQVAFIVALIVLTFLNTKEKVKAVFISMLALVVILSTAYVLSPNFNLRITQFVTSIDKIYVENKYNSSTGIRLSLWIMGLDEITDSISVGNGIGNEMINLEHYAKKHGFPIDDYAVYSDHHNMFITYGVLLGQLGLIILIGLFYLIFTLKIEDPLYGNLNKVFITIFALWSFTGITFHAMDPMTLFVFFVGLFNAMSHNLKKRFSKN